MEPFSAALLGGASLVGGMLQNKAAKSAAARQMAFQKEMSDTSYQRGMEDMKNAGLNPILAGKMGGASTPSGSTYTPQNVVAPAAQVAMQTASANDMYNKSQVSKQSADFAKTVGIPVEQAPDWMKNTYSVKKFIDNNDIVKKVSEPVGKLSDTNSKAPIPKVKKSEWAQEALKNIKRIPELYEKGELWNDIKRKLFQ